MTKNVLIYSKKIAKASETFVIDPAMALQRYHAYFVASLRRYDLPVPDERVFVANTGQGRVSLAKQRLKRYLFGHNGILFLSNQLRQLNPHLLQAHFAHEAVNAIPLAKKLNIPFIIYFHGLDATITSSATAGNAFWENYFAKLPLMQQSADLVLTHSTYLGQRVIDMGFDADKVRTQYVGVSPATQTPLNREVRKPMVLFVARLTEKKGLRYLISAMGEVQNTHPELELVVVGDGALRGQLESQAEETLQNYRFIGWQSPDEVNQWMREALLFCVPSVTAENGDQEGFGMVFIEAQRAGTPVISTLHGGIVESVADGETGILVHEKDSLALAEAIEGLYTNQEMWREMSLAGYQRVQRDFTIPHLVSQLEDTYDEVITKFVRSDQ